MQRFRIDDHLERFESALKNIAQAGAEHFEETVEYTKKHGLFTIALGAFKGDPVKYKVGFIRSALDFVQIGR
jgi:elongator complex protein 1